MAYCSKCGTPIPIGARFCPSCGTPAQAPSPPFSAGVHSPMPDSGFRTLTRDSVAQEYWVKRLLAYVIDAIIVYAVIGLIAAATVLPAFLMGVFVPGSSPRMPFLGGFLGTVSSLILVLYFTLAEATYGKTIGKRVMGLRVAMDSGGRLPLGSSFLRNLSKISWVFLILDVILGLVLETGYKKKYSDRFLGTSVIQGLATV
jgi:uncharacterized RDD family membrane protein YckC